MVQCPRFLEEIVFDEGEIGKWSDEGFLKKSVYETSSTLMPFSLFPNQSSWNYRVKLPVLKTV